MKRREFIAGLGGAIALPLAAPAQQPGKSVIGFLGTSTLEAARQWVAAFEQRLPELGWITGRDVAIDYRWGEGRSERLREIAAEFAKRKVDVIFTHGAQGAIAAKQATANIPVVFVLVGDPIGVGLVTSLSRPGANVTGVSNQLVDLAGKRLELLREAVPGLRRLAILADGGNPTSVLEMGEVKKAADTLGLEASAFEIKRAGDIASTFEALKGRSDALYVCAGPLILTNLARVNLLAVGARLATIHSSRDFLPGGGLMSYGANFPSLFRRGAEYVDKILRGAKPADLPIEQPTKFDLVVSETAAKALGLGLPSALLARADEVIE